MTSTGPGKTIQSTIGVDISKDHLDLCRRPHGAARRFSNGRRGHRSLIAWLGETEVARVVYQPTGPYHRGVERALAGDGRAGGRLHRSDGFAQR